MRNSLFIAFVSFCFILSACEDKIDIKIDEGISQLAVDAFVTNQPDTQAIRLTKTSGYFDNSASPAATGAVVKITDKVNGKEYHFTDSNSSGNYIWVPGVGDTLGVIGNEYALSITYAGEEFTAISVMNPAPPVDSITYVYREANPAAESSAGYVARFYARDFSGRTDFYWIKSYRNGVANNNPSNITLAWDAAFGPGADGFVFIMPIRYAINPQGKPFIINDFVTVEIHAINEETWSFLSEVRTQTSNGGLFATPPANVRTNIKNTNTNSKVKAVGFFNIGAVSSAEIKIQ